ncbi:MAG: hypothetical protein ABII07_03285 [Patescibacteria group bacterium]|nr:hypothetical protein [Patescibacteria group bacterium]
MENTPRQESDKDLIRGLYRWGFAAVSDQIFNNIVFVQSLYTDGRIEKVKEDDISELYRAIRNSLEQLDSYYIETASLIAQNRDHPLVELVVKIRDKMPELHLLSESFFENPSSQKTADSIINIGKELNLTGEQIRIFMRTLGFEINPKGKGKKPNTLETIDLQKFQQITQR